MKRVKRLCPEALALILLCVANLPPCSAGAQIAFETLPDGTATVEGQAITGQYSAQSAGGVTFSAVNGTCPATCQGQVPTIAKVGSPVVAFQGVSTTFPACGVSSATTDDMPAPASQATVQCSFLRVPATAGNPCALQVDYANSTPQASGFLLDVDGSEQWTVQAFLGPTPVGAPVSISAVSGGNGVASPWTVTAPAGQVFDRVLVDYTGTCGSPVGLGFDAFSPSPTTCPGVLIDFESLAHADALEINHYGDIGGRYVEDGFQIIPHIGTVQFYTYGGGTPPHPFFSGSTAYHGDATLSASLTADPGHIAPLAPPFGQLFPSDTFSPIGVVLTERTNTSTNLSVSFTGYFPNQSTVTNTFTLDGVLTTGQTSSSESFFLSGFHGVKYIEFPTEHQIDGICIRYPCQDGLDNDGDGLIDGADPECSSPTDASERLLAYRPAPGLGLQARGALVLLLMATALLPALWWRRRTRP